MFQLVFNLAGVGFYLNTGQKSYNIYFYKCNRGLMSASGCTVVQSLYFILFFLFWAFGPAFYVLQIILLIDCTCHICNFVKLTVQWLIM